MKTTGGVALMSGNANQGSQSPVWNSIQSSPAITAMIPFVLPQRVFQGGLTQQKMGQGLLVQVAAVSANTDFTVVHNLGHPVNVIIPCFGASNVFIPKVKVSGTANSNTAKQLIVQFDTICNPVTIAIF